MLNNFNVALTPLVRSTRFRYGTWDVEARNWWDLLLIGCYDGKDYYHFTSVSDFINHILRREYRDYRWFAHFGGRYDLNFIFDWIRATQPDIGCSFYCSGSMVLQMTLRYRDNNAKLCDSFRLLTGSLRELCKAFGVAHQKGKMDFSNMEYNKELIQYNEQDCIGLYEVLTAFFEQSGITSETFASHALRIFRRDFLQEKIWKPHDGINEFTRLSYCGGHVEVFKRSGNNINAFDVNSMYPFTMLSKVPIRYIGESKQLTNRMYGFVQAVVKVPDIYIPPLPLPLEKLYFPTGRMQGVWTSDELIEGERRGVKIIKIVKAVYFACTEIFKDYVLRLYQIKKTSGEPMRTVAKYLLNSLYGKFGQHPVKKIYITERQSPEGSYPILTPDGKPSGFAYYERASHAAYLLPHISASITSKARLVLLSQLTDRAYYCDTDSIFTDEQFETGTELGQWGLVGKGAATFIQPKLYEFNGKWKAKGLNKVHDPSCIDKSKCECAFQNVAGFVYDGLPNQTIRRKSIKEALQDGQPACQDITNDKVLRETKPKRAWVGNDTRPWTLKELQRLK